MNRPEATEPAVASGRFSMHGLTAVVTGAAHGIGRAVASDFAVAGASVVCIDIDADGLDDSVREITRRGGSARAVVADVTDDPALTDKINESVPTAGCIDVLANVAGAITGRGDILDVPQESMLHGWQLNLASMITAVRAVVPHMPARGGAIVNVASGTLDALAPGLGSYTIPKAGVLQLTRTLAMELGARNIRVNAVSPGYIDTAMTAHHYRNVDGSIDTATRERIHRDQSAATALKRIGTAREIATVVRFLSSGEASFITGQVLRVNGGSAMPL